MANHLHEADLPDGIDLGSVVAIDCETMGLDPHWDRLCLVQMSRGDGDVHLVRVGMRQDPAKAPNLRAMLENPDVLKLFHFGRFDIAAMYGAFGALARPAWCTKIASKIARADTKRHGLKALLKDLLDIDISKQRQSSDWGAEILTDEQIEYAATDVIYLHRLREILQTMLERECCVEMAGECFDLLPRIARLDALGRSGVNILVR